jgi:riboflavin biosynthesis pyrimidine reductase
MAIWPICRLLAFRIFFAGKEKVDLLLALEKLKSIFGIEKMMLEGGGHINGSFLNEGLIDEFHQLLLPLADGRRNSIGVFEIDEKERGAPFTMMKLKEVKKLEDDVLWWTTILLHLSSL